jgi:CDP-diacylglycerol--serine O-phosphatidyltransferase
LLGGNDFLRASNLNLSFTTYHFFLTFRRLSFTKHVPNALTCGNLICGCLALVKCVEGDLVWTAYFIWIGAVFDFLDGLAARGLKAYSAIGKDLDSMTDLVTFGVVPGMIMYRILEMITSGYFMRDIYFGVEMSTRFLPWVAFVIPVLSAIRLARFNNDPAQTEDFIGLPTPACALLISSFPVIFRIYQPFLSSEQVFTAGGVFFNPNNLSLICVLLSLLLISKIPLFSLKLRDLSLRKNIYRYIFISGGIVAFVLFRSVAIPVLFLFYLLLNLIRNYVARKN